MATPSFHNAAAYLSSSSSASRTSNAIKLELYALFKYLTVAVKPTAPKPNIFDMTGRAKWEAWNIAGNKYVDRADAAEKRYIELARELGWDEAAVPVPAPASQTETLPDDELLDDDDDDSENRSKTNGDNGGAGGGGFGLSVSAMLRPAETKDDTIHGITVKGDFQKLNALLEEENLDINQLDEYGYTPLHLACDRGHLEVVRLLLSKGADRTIKDPDDFTPLELAEVVGRSDIVSLLSSK